MADEFEVTWSVEDGYVNNGPHKFDIQSDVLEPDMTEDDIRLLFADEVQDDFNTNASWTSEDEDDFVKWAKEQIAKMKDGE